MIFLAIFLLGVQAGPKCCQCCDGTATYSVSGSCSVCNRQNAQGITGFGSTFQIPEIANRAAFCGSLETNACNAKLANKCTEVANRGERDGRILTSNCKTCCQCCAAGGVGGSVQQTSFSKTGMCSPCLNTGIDFRFAPSATCQGEACKLSCQSLMQSQTPLPEVKKKRPAGEARCPSLAERAPSDEGHDAMVAASYVEPYRGRNHQLIVVLLSGMGFMLAIVSIVNCARKFLQTSEDYEALLGEDEA